MPLDHLVYLLVCAHPTLETTGLNSPHTPGALKPSLDSNVSPFPTAGPG